MRSGFTVSKFFSETKLDDPVRRHKALINLYQFYHQKFCGKAWLSLNKAKYTAQDAPSTRLREGVRTYGRTDGRTDGQTDGPTDRQTNGRTDTPSYRDATAYLKRAFFHAFTSFQLFV